MITIFMVFQLLVSLLCLLAATVATFRPKRLEPLASAFPKSGIKRAGQSAALWVALIANFVGIGVPFVAFFAGCITFATSVPLAINAGRVKTQRAWVLPALLAAGSVLVAIAQPLGLRVLALPKAAELPFSPSPAQVIKTYDEGLWFEGIAAGSDGTLYLSANRRLDFSRSDYYHDGEGDLIVRKPDGSERVVFKTPRGLSSGVPFVSSENDIYLTSHGDTSYIWHIDAAGKARKLAQLPQGAWPNGLDMGPDGLLYSPDSSLGVVWRVDPRSGHVEVALRDRALRARPFISLAPGANGLHFNGSDMLVSVSDRTTVLRYVMKQGGQFGKASVIASGIPGDDFAIGHDGSLFISTHPYNTLVCLSPDGGRTIIGKMQQRIVGATDAVFGKTDRDRNTLYVVTDGGAFTGGPKTRGELVALYPYSRH